ncbi:MAG TPA: hypothetical protein VFU02_20035 [Polyangiaceae bacterium]|nr:hypothetical protein [Polyangiaceae bacterium]
MTVADGDGLVAGSGFELDAEKKSLGLRPPAVPPGAFEHPLHLQHVPRARRRLPY